MGKKKCKHKGYEWMSFTRIKKGGVFWLQSDVDGQYEKHCRVDDKYASQYHEIGGAKFMSGNIEMKEYAWCAKYVLLEVGYNENDYDEIISYDDDSIWDDREYREDNANRILGIHDYDECDENGVQLGYNDDDSDWWDDPWDDDDRW